MTIDIGVFFHVGHVGFEVLFSWDVKTIPNETWETYATSDRAEAKSNTNNRMVHAAWYPHASTSSQLPHL